MFIIFGKSHLDIWPVVVCSDKKHVEKMINSLYDVMNEKVKEALNTGYTWEHDDISISNLLDPNCHYVFTNSVNIDGKFIPEPDVKYFYIEVEHADDPGVLALLARKTFPSVKGEDDEYDYPYTSLVNVI